MLDNQQYFDSGLCFWITKLMGKGIITWKEAYLLEDYIQKNKPFTLYNLLGIGWWWSEGNIKPRIKWIKKHIKKNNYSI